MVTYPFSLDGVDGAVQGVGRSGLKLEDFDGDTNVELEVRFQSAVFNRLLRQTDGDIAIVRASWLYADGKEGTASAQVTVDH